MPRPPHSFEELTLPPEELARLVKDQLPVKLTGETFILNLTINVSQQPAPEPLAQPWVMILGAIFGALTLFFFMGLVLLGVAGHEVPCNTVFLVNITLSLGAALAVAFLGGNASAKGAIPFLQNSLAVSLTGGLAALVIMLIVTFGLLGRNDCTTGRAVNAANPVKAAKTYRFCFGEYERACQTHDIYDYCYTDQHKWANAHCSTHQIVSVTSYGGNKCGYTIFDVVCENPH